MSIIKIKDLEFIRLMATGSTQSEAFRVSMGKKQVTKGYAEKQGCILAKKYADEIYQAKHAEALRIQEANTAAEVQRAIQNIVCQADADAKAFRILGDKDQVVEKILFNGKTKTLRRPPTQLEIQRAYQLYCNRYGLNAPIKNANTNSKGEDIPPPQSPLDLSKLSIDDLKLLAKLERKSRTS